MKNVIVGNEEFTLSPVSFTELAQGMQIAFTVCDVSDEDDVVKRFHVGTIESRLPNGKWQGHWKKSVADDLNVHRGFETETAEQEFTMGETMFTHQSVGLTVWQVSEVVQFPEADATDEEEQSLAELLAESNADANDAEEDHFSEPFDRSASYAERVEADAKEQERLGLVGDFFTTLLGGGERMGHSMGNRPGEQVSESEQNDVNSLMGLMFGAMAEDAAEEERFEQERARVIQERQEAERIRRQRQDQARAEQERAQRQEQVNKERKRTLDPSSPSFVQDVLNVLNGVSAESTQQAPTAEQRQAQVRAEQEAAWEANHQEYLKRFFPFLVTDQPETKSNSPKEETQSLDATVPEQHPQVLPFSLSALLSGMTQQRPSRRTGEGDEDGGYRFIVKF